MKTLRDIGAKPNDFPHNRAYQRPLLLPTFSLSEFLIPPHASLLIASSNSYASFRLEKYGLPAIPKPVFVVVVRAWTAYNVKSSEIDPLIFRNSPSFTPQGHSGPQKKKHVCATCDRAFTTSGHLARHSRVHTGEKNHKCPFPGCETRCSRQDNLQQQ